MRIVFSLGLGFVSKLYLNGLPTPSMWVKTEYVNYVAQYNFHRDESYDNTTNMFRDAFKRTTSEVKKL